jgi:S1-C subfamily serine protease
MASVSDWKILPDLQPRPADYEYDLDRALSSIVGLRATVPNDAFTADNLGTERTGNGVIIREDGLILTIGYLITEADQIWLHLTDGTPVPGHALAYDQESGFGLVQALARINLPILPLGQSADVMLGEPVVVGGAGGRHHSVAARIAAKQEFAGSWEYVVDEALFTAPAHPNWGGTALIGGRGELLGIGSLQLEQSREGRENEHLNMMVPIDLLKPILHDLLTLGRRNEKPRPWLGLYATEVEDRVVIVGLAKGGPAQRASLRTGDLVLSVAGQEVDDLADLYRSIWAQGPAGTEIPLLVYRDGRPIEVRVISGDRNRFLKTPRLH